jgi:hypothetical protein
VRLVATQLCAAIPAGSSGALTAIVIFGAVASVVAVLNKGKAYTFEAGNIAGAFEPRLVNYIRVAETIIGLATGSIVLLAGSSVLRTGGKLPWFYASPLVLLGFSVVYSVFFIAFIVFFYEAYLHNEDSYTRARYILNNAMGFSALVCFAVGYIWLGFSIAH